MTSPVQERKDLLVELSDSADQLASSMDVRLVPARGGNIGYALRGARDKSSVAAITGGLLVEGTSVRCAGPVAFGADEEISRIILTAMKFDPSVRSAAVIRYTDPAFLILSEMVIDSAETDPVKYPGGISTMDWAVAACCSEGVPGVIAIRGIDPEKHVICIFGEDPAEITSNIIILSNRIQ
jgi:hydroxymethylpyrimidine/phosphomethylpyrimidine kinase